MKLHLLALFLLVAPQLDGVLERVQSDAGEPAKTRASSNVVTTPHSAPQPQPSPAPLTSPSSN